MKVALKPGAEIETLTREELRAELESLRLALARNPATVRAEEDGATAATGALTLPFYQVPMGMGFKLTRCAVFADGFTPAVPFNGAGAFLELLRNDVPVAFQSLVAGAGGGLPFVLIDADSESSAAWAGNGEQFAIRLTAGPASTGIIVRTQGVLEPIVLGN